MAIDTPLNYRNLVIYEIYVRNHGVDGTFANVVADLPRIREMGVDVIWFMPIHPIGQKNKKGAWAALIQFKITAALIRNMAIKKSLNYFVNTRTHWG